MRSLDDKHEKQYRPERVEQRPAAAAMTPSLGNTVTQIRVNGHKELSTMRDVQVSTYSLAHSCLVRVQILLSRFGLF